MATNLVNVDALIPREDFEVEEERSEWQTPTTLRVNDLEQTAFVYNALRKPDFQRETANWSPEKITDFVRTFLDGDLIPAIILWNTGRSVFVIDGAHRLSALIAWVQDDYGDGKTSRTFFENLIPLEQEKAATATRKLIQQRLGTYSEHTAAVVHPEKSKTEVVARARRLATLTLQLQWVTGDAKKAEASFFKINQEATPIDPTELRILKARHLPNAVAARVIVRSATGHKYWSKFPPERQQEIKQVGTDIYDTLFKPPLQTPIKTLDIPVAGRGYSAQTLPLIFELVNLTNDVRIIDPSKLSKKASISPTEPPDGDGGRTVDFLKNTRRIVQRISGLHPSSLGLHPVVYFYSRAGRYQPTSFLAVVSLLKELETQDHFRAFTDVRRKFEDFILAHKTYPNQITVKRGSGVKGFSLLKDLYYFVYDQLQHARDESAIVDLLKADERFSFLTDQEDEELMKRRANFDSPTKSAVFLKEALENPVRCRICSCLIHYNSITVDHVVRRQDGGFGVKDNGQIAHPYCNTTYKN